MSAAFVTEDPGKPERPRRKKNVVEPPKAVPAPAPRSYRYVSARFDPLAAAAAERPTDVDAPPPGSELTAPTKAA